MEKFFVVFWWWGPLKRSNLIQANSVEEAKDIWEKTIASRYADGVALQSIVSHLNDGETEEDRIVWIAQ